MRISTTALVVAVFAASAAGAQPIIVVDAPTLPRPAPSNCAVTQPSGNVECVLTLAPTAPGAERQPPGRILIRTQWATKRCAIDAQVVDLARSAAPDKPLPSVDQAATGRGCS
ncbi:MAG TPA: hypothetical protein VF474_00950 [Phenylobacterium sp.]